MINASTQWNQLFENINNDLLPESDVMIYSRSNNGVRSLYNSITVLSGGNTTSTLNDLIQKSRTPIELKTDYISQIKSDVYGNFDSPPRLMIRQNQSTITYNEFTGWLTFVWSKDGSYPTSFTIYHGTKADTFEGHSGPNIVYIDDSDWKRWDDDVVIEINGWSEGEHSAEMCHIYNGFVFYIDRNTLHDYSCNKTMDIMSGQMPTDEVDVTFFDLEGNFDPNYGRYHNKVDTVNSWAIAYGFKIDNEWEYHTVGTYYITQISRAINGMTANWHMSTVLSKIQGHFPLVQQGSQDDPRENYFWKSWKECMQKIGQACGVDIIVETSEYSDAEYNLYGTQYAYRSSLPLRDWLYTTANASQEIILVEDDTIVVKPLKRTNASGQFEYIYTTSLFNIKLDNCYRYPEIAKLGAIKNVTIIGSKNPNAQNDTTHIYQYTEPYSSSGVDQTITNDRLRFLDPKYSNVGLLESYAKNSTIWIGRFLHNATKITGEGLINPLIQIGDFGSSEIKVGQKDDGELKVTTMKGYVTSLNISYNGTFKTRFELFCTAPQNV